LPARSDSRPPSFSMTMLLGHSDTRTHCVGVLIATLICVLRPEIGVAVEIIHSFDSEIRIDVSGSMEVVETITVTAEGGKIKRGIYRDFPTDYRDRYGNQYKVRFEVIKVSRDGQSERFHTQGTGGGLRVYIGRENVILPRGTYTYEIVYRTDRQLGFFEDHDELYWNVTGNEWDFPIEHASATVHLPKPASEADLSVEGYTGHAGSKQHDLIAKVIGTGEAHFETTRPLAMREGLTIVFGWPKGIVREPTMAKRTTDLLSDNAHLFAGLIGYAILLGYYLFFWNRVGKDPEPGVLIARYDPPKGYSPASMRYIEEMGYDKKCFTAAVLNLAVKGFLTIEQDGGSYALVRTPNSVEMAPGEDKLANALFGARTRIDLDNKNHKVISKALDKHEQALSDDYENKYFINNRRYFFGGVVISIIVAIISFLLFPENSDSQAAVFLAVWSTIWWSITGLGLYRTWMSLRHAHGPASRLAALVRVLFMIPFVIAGGVVLAPMLHVGATGPVVIGFALIATNVLFYHLLKAPTLVGRKLLDKADGFKRYVEVAEKLELDARYPEGRTPQLFERYLPYGSFNGAVASSSTAPGSSSGGGGGGSSGGGGGGGGGGGW